MMKKFYVLLAVAAMVCVSSIALAAEVTVGGSVDIWSRNFRDLDLNKKVGDGEIDTQERVRLDVNVKAGAVKGKVTIENDWDTLGRFEAIQGTTTVATGATNTTTGAVSASRLGFREAWMLFPVPSTPINVKAGHMLLQLGNGWFFRSNKYGSDAWVAYTDIDKLHLVLVDVKVSEGLTSQADDVDAYMLGATLKASETMKFGADLTMVNDRKNALGFGGVSTKETQVQNLGLHFDGKAGPVGLKAEIDVQTGKAKGNDAKFKGNQVVIQGIVPMDPVTINFTAARGSGAKLTDNDYKEMITFLDLDPRYTFLYEYKIKTASGAKSTGFSNTTALSAGAMFKATKSLAVGADLWLLQATEKTNVNGGSESSDVGTELDVKLNWMLADNLTWNWLVGYFKPGAVYKTAAGTGTDASTGVQGALSMKF